MIVGGQTKARAQLSSTVIDYHEPFDQGFKVLSIRARALMMRALVMLANSRLDYFILVRTANSPRLLYSSVWWRDDFAWWRGGRTGRGGRGGLQPPQNFGRPRFFGQQEKFGQRQLFKMFSSCFLNR